MTDREIDTLVAGRIMGWKAGEPPHYSTSIEAANQVFHRMNGHPDWKVWEAFNTALNGRLSDNPRAVCLAALKACGVEVSE